MTTAGPSTRERKFLEQTRQWVVRERVAPGIRAGAPRCLVFMSESAVRRVWDYPQRWYELDDAELRALMHAPVRGVPRLLND